MEFFEVVRKRQSIRAYAPKPISEKALSKILEAARAAPSAGNLQAYDIVVVTERSKKAALARAALGQEFIAQAPVVLVFFARPERSAAKYGARGAQLYSIQDATIAAAFAKLAATALALGAAWVGAFDEAEVGAVLGAPASARPVAIMPLGWPAEKPERTPRLPLTKLVHREHF